MDGIAQEILIYLTAAHFLGDFVFQTDAIASGKKRTAVLLKNAAIVAALGYLLCGIWSLWKIPLVIFLTHSLVDYIKVKTERETVCSFIIDQILHLAVILAVVFALDTNFIPVTASSTLWTEMIGRGFLRFSILITGFTVSVKAGAILIGLAVKPFTDQLMVTKRMETGDATKIRGFENGGKVIGYLERSLIFFFILTGQPTGIGFLIAAKSILRFGEVKDRENRMEAEYIIIGTLMSFGYGMFIAYLTKFFMDHIR
ncbi:MAG: DUF3307 domain-containing protein [Acidobacteria bacterium]|nr:DUF3307 domain-containing protein [Acidobacteriota bacterium]